MIVFDRYNISTIKIYAGQHKSLGTGKNVQERVAVSIAAHPEFEMIKTIPHNDIALITPNTPFILNSHVNTVCLPT